MDADPKQDFKNFVLTCKINVRLLDKKGNAWYAK